MMERTASGLAALPKMSGLSALAASVLLARPSWRPCFLAFYLLLLACLPFICTRSPPENPDFFSIDYVYSE